MDGPENIHNCPMNSAADNLYKSVEYNYKKNTNTITK